MTVIDILPPEPRSARGRLTHRATGNVADAAFVTVNATSRRNAPAAERSERLRPRSAPRRAVAEKQTAGAILSMIERSLMNLSADVFAALVAVVFVTVFGLAGGFALFLAEPARAHAAGLDLTHVNLTPQDANGMSLLLITGIIKNNSEDPLDALPIHADLMSDGATVASAVIDPPVPAIRAGESHGFSARIPHPGGKMPQLRLSFASAGASTP
ncbi:hypothetical protein ACWGPT_11580 [Pseudorhizobium sp. NPDC055634]